MRFFNKHFRYIELKQQINSYQLKNHPKKTNQLTKKINLIIETKMKKIILLLTIILSFSSYSQDNKVIIANNNDGMRLVVNGKDFMINGMNWDYFPIGTNYSYSLWNQSDKLIQEALDEEMGLLNNGNYNLFTSC